MNDKLIERIDIDIKSVSKRFSIFGFISILMVLFVLIVSMVLIGLQMSNVSIEIQGLKIEVEKGNGDKISLKEDAFKVIDDTEIILEDGLNDVEIEEALNNHKYGSQGKIDGGFGDQLKNIKTFNEVWGIEKGIDNNSYLDENFRQRLSYTHNQHIWRLDWDYFNQRSFPKIGNIICVPSSALILLKALGYNVNINKLIEFFSNNEDINNYARKHFRKWIESFIETNKLYQITGVFTYGFNLFMETHYPSFPYELNYDYWNIYEIADYVETFGLMSATYLPSYVFDKKRKGGHMICITKVYKDFNGNIIALGVNDPFGNPNVAYRGVRGWDGKNVIIGLDTMKIVMKSYRDDHKVGPNYLYRILYFKDKQED